MTHAGNAEWTNVRLEANVRLGAGSGTSTRIYLAVRAAPSASNSKLDYYHAYLTGDGKVRIGQYIDGSTTDLADPVTTSVTLDEATWHQFAVTVDGSTISAELDGTVYSTFEGASGRDSGFIALGVDGGVAEFDNVSVSVPNTQ